jgi:hypothetical protein
MDYFSIRWTGLWEFEAGEYTFFVEADDGVVLWLDEGEPPLIDKWNIGGGVYQATVRFDTPGLHRLRVHYLEWTGDAHVRLHWRRTDIYPLWQGDYFAEPWVEGGYDRTQMDSSIQFDWGSDCPEDLPCDSFSIQWTASPLLQAGTHRLFMYADEGFRLFVDGRLRDRGGWDLNEAGGSQDNMIDMYVATTQQKEITFDFHDQGGLAEARLWIQPLNQPKFKVEFFGNPFLNGAPVATEYYHAAFEDWGYGRAHEDLPSADTFSIRWSGDRFFHAGCYIFFVYVDDGARLWIDDEQLIDEWFSRRGTYNSLVTCLTTGYHEVILEYYESTNEAEIRFWWE